jgi:murein DD-endopeptidase MepM/ murein hydrolase activator NlpD
MDTVTVEHNADQVVDALVAEIQANQKIRARVPRSPWKDARPSVDKDVIAAEKAFLKPRGKRFAKLGSKGVPRLLHHLRSGNRDRQAIAFYGLQFCWDEEAQEPVSRFLADDDYELRLMAAIVTISHAGYETLARLCKPHLDDHRPHIAGFAFDHLDSEYPDAKRMGRFLKQTEYHPYIWKRLSRYHTRDLTSDTLGLLDSSELALRLTAMVSLIHQNADDAEVLGKIMDFLQHDTPAVREVAAEYLSWHGTVNELPWVKASLKVEEDLFARASLVAAQDAIERRYRKFGKILQVAAKTAPVGGNETDISTDRYRALADELQSRVDLKSYEKAIQVYRYGEPFEPQCAWRGSNPPDAFIANRQARLALQAQIFTTPLSSEGVTHEFVGEFTAPRCKVLVPPTRYFFDSNRTAFGLHIPDTEKKGFGGLVHIGDDLAYNCPNQTLIAIGDGLVRYVGCTPSWGYMIIIEHQDADGERLCSLYAHIGPFVTVVPGQQVVTGQKIGSIGRSNSWENGGYTSHLHFGMHLGPYVKRYQDGDRVDVRFKGKMYRGTVIRGTASKPLVRIHTDDGPQELYRNPSWVCGYISKAGWEEGGDGWINPQLVIQHNSIHVGRGEQIGLL